MPQLILKQLTLLNFKTYTQQEISFSHNVNCFVGENGIGKTNLLDAVYYLSFCKSFINPVDSQNIKDGEAFFLIQGEYVRQSRNETLVCSNHIHKKKIFKRNGNEYEKLSDHIGLVPCVMVSPEDTNLILGGSEDRRKFIDGVIAQYDKTYLHNLLQYNKLIAQRNALLKHFAETKTFDTDQLDIYDEPLSNYAAEIFNRRNSFLNEFIPLFNEFYHIVSQNKEEVNLNYQSHLLHNNLQNLFKQHLQKDLAFKYTTTGIHKDDLEFLLGQKPLKKFGSQGQQKTYVTALKLAQFYFMKKHLGFPPILLLDDIFDKLDEKRVKAMLNLVGGDSFGQIFVTHTSKERIQKLFEDLPHEVFIFEVLNGQVNKINHD